MYNFISFLERRDDDLWFRHYETISEMSMAELEARKPKDGRWEDSTTFVFNIEGDDCGGSGPMDERCYKVVFNYMGPYVDVSFKRNNEYKDERRGFGSQVFMGVQYAIMEFVKKNNPDYLVWNPIKTSTPNPVTGQITNPEGRRDAYEIFAIKSLLPMYVSKEVNVWMRRDIYEKEFVPEGYPPIPEGLSTDSSPLEKKKFLQSIRDAVMQVKEKKAKKSEEERRRTERISFHRGMDQQRVAKIRDLGLSQILNTDKGGGFVLYQRVFTFLTPETINRSYGKHLYDEPNSISQLKSAMQEFNTDILKISGFYAPRPQPRPFSTPVDNRTATHAEVFLSNSSGNSIMKMFFDLRDLSKSETPNSIFKK